LSDRYARRAREGRKAIGLYTYEQEKNTTPFQYFAQIVIGGVFTSVGGLLVYHVLTLRKEETRAFGSAETHVWDWVVSLAAILIGVFQAHAGVIFWGRRMIKGIGFGAKLHDRNNHG
jgi:hypothetical protein